jgi:20S proteasome subunit beta 1
MGVVYRDGVILGADSRTSTGSYVANRVADKIVPLIANLAEENNPSPSTSTASLPATTVWACRSGSAADTQAVVDHTRYALDAHW